MRFTFGIALIVSLAALLGCGKSEQCDTARVRGTVTLDGAPYTQGGIVLFQPKVQCKMASGKIRSDGTYELSTYANGDGAAVGKHKVTVMPLPATTANPDGDAQADVAISPSPFPRRYSSAAKSGLECEVKAGATNEFSIEMKSR